MELKDGVGSACWHSAGPCAVSMAPTGTSSRSGPAVVIASDLYLEQADNLAIIVPCTSVDRGWPNHVELRGDHGLVAPTYVMTEQPRTITRRRVVDVSGRVDRATMREIDGWLKDFLSLS